MPAVPIACFCLIGCGYGGVEAVSSNSKADGAGFARAVSLDTTPQVLPRHRRKSLTRSAQPAAGPRDLTPDL